jgi:ankyrin repeat protein
MTFDRASLDQAISSLENAKPLQKSGHQELGDLIGEIVQAVMGEDSVEKMEVKANEQFDHLTELAIAGNLEVFTQLLATESISRSENQPTLLMGAVLAGQIEVVRALIKAGADVNIRVKQFFYFDALKFAIDKEYLEIVKILIAAGADLNWQDPALHPLTKAVSKNNVEILKVLLKAGANTTFQTGFSLLGEASQDAGTEVINILIDAGCDVNLIDRMGSTPLMEACLLGRDDVVEILLNAGADPNLPRRDGFYPLIAAFSIPEMVKVSSKWKDNINCDNLPERMNNVINLLLNAGADRDSRSYDGKTALMIAARQGLTEITRTLISKGATINAQEDCGNWIIPNYEAGTEDEFIKSQHLRTALVFAVEQGHSKIVEELLENGADINILDNKKKLPINIAIQEGYTDIIKLLQNTGAKASIGDIEFSAPALLGAAKQGNLEILKSALAAGIDPNVSEIDDNPRNPRHKTALMFAVERGHLAIVEHLIIAGADVNLSNRPGKKLGKTPLMYAAESDHPEIVKLLLRSGAIVDAQDKRGQTALYYAVLEQKTEAVKSLLEYGADPHKKNWDGTPFKSATYSNKEIVMLITHYDQSKGSEVSDRAREEMLQSASFKGDLGIVRELIAQGVNLTAKDHNGWNALSYACAKGHLDITQVLLAAGADVNIKDQSGCTALSEAAYWGHLEIVNILLSAGAEVNGLDNEEGSIPLFKTIYFERTSILEVLLAAGANPSLRNEDGKTVLEFAIEQQKMEIVEVLQRFAG